MRQEKKKILRRATQTLSFEGTRPVKHPSIMGMTDGRGEKSVDELRETEKHSDGGAGRDQNLSHPHHTVAAQRTLPLLVDCSDNAVSAEVMATRSDRRLAHRFKTDRAVVLSHGLRSLNVRHQRLRRRRRQNRRGSAERVLAPEIARWGLERILHRSIVIWWTGNRWQAKTSREISDGEL